MHSTPIAPVLDSSAAKKSGGAKNVADKKFSELGWPGVEILNGACTSILHPPRGSQLPYNKTSKTSWFLLPIFKGPYLFPIFPVWSYPIGAHGSSLFSLGHLLFLLTPCPPMWPCIFTRKVWTLNKIRNLSNQSNQPPGGYSAPNIWKILDLYKWLTT